MKEIGSEFYLQVNGFEPLENNNKAFLLSGRTALDFIVRDIKSSKPFKTVLLPSFCCETMIEPFLKNGIKVFFYSVNEKSIDYHSNNYDAILLLDYFGYDEPFNKVISNREKGKKIIIYDSTHRLNSTDLYCDYSFCSYRKWFYCNYAIAEKHCGSFNIPLPTKTNKNYVSCRDKAASLKKNYIEHHEGNKEDYLKAFSLSEHNLERDYCNYLGIPVKADLDYIRKIRLKNASVLINELTDINWLELWKPSLNAEDSPLFVPILVHENMREGLKKYLINNAVYCPVHWPKPDIQGADSVMYNIELSLICDQRYTENDMLREAEIIKSFNKGDIS